MTSALRFMPRFVARSLACPAWLVVVASLVACGDDDGGVTPVDDAGTESVDWVAEVFGDGPPTAGCGDRLLAPGESCDDGNQRGGDGCSAECRWETSCGNGVLEAGEVCDDGNGRDGDGCRSDCTIERCGDGVHDVAAGELCDGPPCEACVPPATCGDGVLDEGEACDDGNRARYDGCAPDCRSENVYVITELAFSNSRSDGCDFIGSGIRANAFGRALRTIGAVFNAEIARNIQAGALVLAMTLIDWDPGTPPPPSFLLGVGAAAYVDSNVRSIRMRRDPGPAPWVLRASADGNLVTTTPGSIVFGVPAIVEPALPIQRGYVELLATSTGLDGRWCGAVSVRDFAIQQDRGSEAQNQLSCVALPRIMNFADAIAGGRSIGSSPTQPDVDLDGDGLEQLIIAGRTTDTCAPVIVGCIEGDGTRIDDPNCVFDVADGYSLAMTFRAEPASFATDEPSVE